MPSFIFNITNLKGFIKGFNNRSYIGSDESSIFSNSSISKYKSCSTKRRLGSTVQKYSNISLGKICLPFKKYEDFKNVWESFKLRSKKKALLGI